MQRVVSVKEDSLSLGLISSKYLILQKREILHSERLQDSLGGVLHLLLDRKTD